MGRLKPIVDATRPLLHGPRSRTLSRESREFLMSRRYSIQPEQLGMRRSMLQRRFSSTTSSSSPIAKLFSESRNLAAPAAAVGFIAAAAAIYSGYNEIGDDEGPVEPNSAVDTDADANHAVVETPPSKINVDFLLYLSDNVNTNLEYLVDKLLAEFAEELEQEKRSGKKKKTAEERRVEMIRKFEDLLERVRNAVYRNNYVTEEEVQRAFDHLSKNQLPGGSGDEGGLSSEQAEKFQLQISRMERLRWLATGDREPLIKKDNLENVVPVEKLIEILLEQSELMQTAMSELVLQAKAAGLRGEKLYEDIMQRYLERTNEISLKVQNKHNIDAILLQDSLRLHSMDTKLQTTLQKIMLDQTERFQALFQEDSS